MDGHDGTQDLTYADRRIGNDAAVAASKQVATLGPPVSTMDNSMHQVAVIS